MGRDFYAILGISRDADQQTIKKAYRREAMKWHPDKNPDNVEEAQKKFQDISDAYQTLSDPDKKSAYDRFGEEGLSGSGGQSGFSHMSGGFVNPEELFRTFFNTGFGFHSTGNGGFGHSFMFSGRPFSMFSGFDDDDDDFWGSSRRSRPQPPSSPAPIELNLSCTLEQLHTGCTKKLLVARTVKGKNDQIEVHVDVPMGARNGTKIPILGVGNQNSTGPAGDVIFFVQERKHKYYTRSGDDLVTEEKISLKDALSGHVLHRIGIEGEEICYPIDRVIKPNDTIILEGKGMNSPSGTKRGDMIIKFNVVFPEELSQPTKDFVRNNFPDM